MIASPAEAEALRESGDAAGARRACEEFLRLLPGHPAGLALMAALAADEGDCASALNWARRASDADPKAAGPHYTVGRAQQAEGRLAEAEAGYRRSLELDPRQPKAHNNLGCVLQMQGRLDEAAEAFRRAIALDPGLAQAQQNLAGLTSDRAALEQAAAAYRRQAAENAADAEACNHLGNACRELGLHREALASFDEAIRRAPDYAEAHFSRSQELLLLGEWEEGWREHEWRWKLKGLGMPPRDCVQPEWNGAVLRGTLLLHAEQGLGDTIQFARYLPMAMERCGAVVLECAPQLAGLLRAAFPGARIVARGDALPAFDAHLPLMSLPRIFGTTPASVPWSGPYLKPDASRVAAWRRELSPAARRRVGLAWAGSPRYWDDRKRSIALAALAPLAALEGVALYSLQWGTGTEQLATLPEGMRVTDFGDRIRDLGEAAALVAALDLVVSVDSSTTHLAGAMGVPAWLLLAHAPDWRWLLDRADSPWYPSVRIFRQASDRRWEGVVARAAAELRLLH
jgi:Flp pilus assembly protein TadD